MSWRGAGWRQGAPVSAEGEMGPVSAKADIGEAENVAAKLSFSSCDKPSRRRSTLRSNREVHSIRRATDIEAIDDRQRLQINNGDIIVRSTRDERSRAIGIHCDAGGTFAEAHALDFLSGTCIQ